MEAAIYELCHSAKHDPAAAAPALARLAEIGVAGDIEAIRDGTLIGHAVTASTAGDLARAKEISAVAR